MGGGDDPGYSGYAFGRLGGGPRTGTWLYLLLCRLMRSKTKVTALILAIVVLVGGELVLRRMGGRSPKTPGADRSLWQGPDSTAIPAGSAGALIRYGKDLIARTGYYFGPAGMISHTSNGMNCQNCHIDAGRRPWGNNFGGVRSILSQIQRAVWVGGRYRAAGIGIASNEV